MEHCKLYCKEHPYEAITNFCADSECLEGLCATCICEHTQGHMRRGSSPRYQNIKDTYQEYNRKMRTHLDQVEADKEWLGSVCQQIEDKRGNVQKALREAREDCLRTVNRHFDELEGRIESEIANEGKKNSLHSYYRLETLNTLLSKEVGNLLVYANDLTSPKFLETIPKVEKEVFPNSQEFHLRATKELKENEVYTASVSYRQDLLPELTNHLKRLINLDFLLPRVEYVVELGRGQSREQVRPQSLRKSTSSVVLTSPRVGDANLKTFSVFNPKPTTSVILTSAPVSPVLNSLRNQSMTGSMLRSSRLACDLKSIRETKREISGIDSSSSLTSSLLGKENDLAHSTYYDSSSNFFKQ